MHTVWQEMRSLVLLYMCSQNHKILKAAVSFKWANIMPLDLLKKHAVTMGLQIVQ